MSDLIYLTLKGRKQGLISAGCSSIDSIGNKGQLDHTDQIFIYIPYGFQDASRRQGSESPGA